MAMERIKRIIILIILFVFVGGCITYWQSNDYATKEESRKCTKLFCNKKYHAQGLCKYNFDNQGDLYAKSSNYKNRKQ